MFFRGILVRHHISIKHNRTLLNILKPLTIFAWLLVFSGCFAMFLIQAAISSAGDYCAYPVSFLNDRAGDITGAAALNAPGFVVPEGLTGEGQIVAVADSGLDAGSMDDIHPDLQSTPGKMPKVVLLKSWAGRALPDDPDGHGTHMAATIAGTGAASNGKFHGIAPGASIYFQAILNNEGLPEPPSDLAELFYPAYSAGARVHVDGWGGGSDSYTGAASQTDSFMRIYPDFLAIFGAGNSGPSASTITGEANSKNALVVGASNLPRPAFAPGEEDTTAAAEFSSRGPAGDGRIKPELLAPASAVISARSRLVEGNLPGSQAYTRLQGTSMAAAVAGGSSALLREYFKKYMNIAAPSAALVKAALVNGSRPAAGGPSQEGFGTIDLAGTVIALKESTSFLADEWAGISQGEDLVYTFRVTGSKAPFKATLAWTDPPAETGRVKTLVNDLDLTIRTPDGRIFNGNHFLGANVPDRTNNIEQVYLPSPVPGDYVIKVSGAAVHQNTVQGSGVMLQDFALVWGQTPAAGTVEKADGGSVALDDGTAFNVTGASVLNLVNDIVAPADASHLFPGAAVFQTPAKDYLVARIWRATGVKVLKTREGTVLTEINPSARLGGYSLAEGTDRIILNKALTDPESIPPGVEISAVVNPLDQKIRQVNAVYNERTGVVSAIGAGNGQEILYLAGGGAFRISPEAAFSFEDSYANNDVTDMPFGTGALEELAEVLPGMPVLLRLAPSSGEIQYLAVKRRVALGTILEVNLSDGWILLENGASYKILQGVQLKRDKQSAGFTDLKPGDHITAVLLPDTGEVIGIVAYSNMSYAKTIDFSKKDRTLYLLDDNGRYRSLYLPADAIIYRWGVRTTAEAVTAGSRIRVAADPEENTVWQLDIAETLYNNGVIKSFDIINGFMYNAEGSRYRIAGSTRYYKNGYPVLPEDLRSGEYVELEYTAAPPPTGSVLVSVNANTIAPLPMLQASVIPLHGRLVVTGRTGANTTVYIWEGNSIKQAPANEAGRFYLEFKPEGEGNRLTIVAVDHHTGGIKGGQVSFPRDWLENYNTLVLDAVSGSEAGPAPDPETPLTRAETASILVNLLNWPQSGEWPLTFADMAEIPASYRPAAAEACARGIFKGYPDSMFRPMAALSRAEAAVVFAALLRDVGLGVRPGSPLNFSDAADIPSWAAAAIADTDAAGLFPDRRDGAFAPGEPVTRGEMTAILNHFLAYCGTNL
jgi:hypothetical protein